MISVIPVKDVPILSTTDEFWQEIKRLTSVVNDNDILVVAHTPWSRVNGPKYRLEEITPSDQAIILAEELEKDPRHVEVILRESQSIVKTGRKVIVTENHAGVVCANAGVDQSNAGIGNVIAVPHHPDQLANQIRSMIKENSEKNVAVIISDTVGRALRRGAVNIGIGTAGIDAMRSEKGKADLFGYTMRVSEVAIIDELASAAELVQRQTNEGTPFVIIRGYEYGIATNASAQVLNRPENERIFK